MAKTEHNLEIRNPNIAPYSIDHRILYRLCPRILRAYPSLVWLKVYRPSRVCEIRFHQKV